MRKAVVLGATSGIGRAIAEMLIRDGWTVGIGSRRTELLEELRKSAPDRVFVEPLDVRESTADEGLLRLAEARRHGPLLLRARDREAER